MMLPRARAAGPEAEDGPRFAITATRERFGADPGKRRDSLALALDRFKELTTTAT
jgi:hypothetical protein